MRFLILSLLVSTFAFSAAAPKNPKRPKVEPPKGESIRVVSQKGNLTLFNQKRELITVTNLNGARVELKRPALFKNFLRLLVGDLSYSIYLGADEFNFLVPAKLYDLNGELSVHQKHTGQNYHIKVSRVVKDYKSVVSEKVISCTYTTSYQVPDTSVDSDGNVTTTWRTVTDTHWGTQRAIVDDQTWAQKMILNIYYESEGLTAETDFTGKAAQVTVRELTHCR